MDVIQAIILGFVEGATEFIPVSSSGHLIIARNIMGLEEGGLAFDAILQLSASLALLVYFWKDILRLFQTFFSLIQNKPVEKKEKTLFFVIIIATIPAVVFGLLLEDLMESIFRNINLVALTLVLGSVLFWVADKVATKNKELTFRRGIIIGFFQCLALVPGISRSGATISGGLIVGLNQDEAVRFSFLLSMPIIFGAGFKKFYDVYPSLSNGEFGMPLLAGSLVAFVTAVFAIGFLIKYLKNHNLTVFIWYRIALALAIFLVF